MLGMERQKELLGCDDISCMAQIGGALGVDALLSVKVGKIGSTYRLSASLIHIAKAEVLVRASTQTSGEADALIGMVEHLVRATLEPIR
jgi:hypothetical protein